MSLNCTSYFMGFATVRFGDTREVGNVIIVSVHESNNECDKRNACIVLVQSDRVGVGRFREGGNAH